METRRKHVQVAHERLDQQSYRERSRSVKRGV